MKDGRAHAGGYVLSCDKGLKQQRGECEMHKYVFKRLLMLIPVILGVYVDGGILAYIGKQPK